MANRACIVCPSKHIYEYCPNCQGKKSIETWRVSFCSENCKNIYTVLEDFACNRITAEEAKQKINKYDLSDREFFIGTLKRDLDKILSVPDSTPIVVEEEISVSSFKPFKQKRNKDLKSDVNEIE